MSLARLRRTNRIALLCLSPLATAALLIGQQEGLQLPRGTPFTQRHFDTSSGLPQNTVAALAETRDGAMWIGTFGGLCRFDGRDWQQFDAASTPAFDDNRIVALTATDDGALWVATELGIVLRWQNGAFARIVDLPGQLVRSLLPQADGRLWCGTESDVFVREADGTVHPAYGSPVPRVRQLLELDSGTLWACTDVGLYRLDTAAPSRLRGERVCGACRMPDGRMLLGTNEGLLAWRDGEFTSLASWHAGVDENQVLRLTPQPDGSVWLATPHHLVHWFAPEDPRNLALPTTARIDALALDRTGGVWAGFSGRGVARLRTSELRAAKLASSAQDTAATVIGDGQGGFYFGDPTGLRHLQADGLQVEVAGLVPGPVSALLREPDGTLLVGGQDVVTIGTGGSWREHRLPVGPDPTQVVSLCRDALGTLWIGTQRGVLRLRDRLEPADELPELANENVRLLVTTPDGALWLGSQHLLLRLRVEKGERTVWRYGRDLPEADVRAVLTDASGGTWLGTYGGGFVALAGDHFQQVTDAQGLVDNYVCAVTPFAGSWLVGGNRGAFLVDPQALAAVAAGKAARLACRPLTPPHGVLAEANGGQQPTVAVEGNRFALCSLDGLLLGSTDDLAPPPATPPVAIEVRLAGDQTMAPDGAAGLLTCLADRTLLVQLTAPYFDTPSPLHYRWRLVPGGEWSAPSPQNPLTVAVREPGDFRLEAEAFSVAGAAPAQTTLAIRVLPHLWERTPFRLAGLGLLAIGTWLVFRLGSARAARRAHALQHLVDERTGELREAQDHLEQRVVDRTAELEQAMRRIEADHEQRVALERELQRAQRIDSLGHLAGGIAHDFNNLLTVVVGHTAMLQIQLREHPEAADSLARIREASEQGRGMTQHLLAVASQQAVTTTVLDLGAQLRDQQNVLRDLLGLHIDLTLALPPEPLFVQAAANQIEQIVMNLCVNARDAMPRGGRLRIAADLAVSAPEVTAPDQVELLVEDDGVGMTEDVRQRAFEPFFTTKRGHRGVGLGLATVYGVTKQLRGTVTIASAPDQGTQFRFRFPRANPPVEVPRPARPAAPGAAALRVLLIEDDPAVRRVLRRLLDLQGCHVVGEGVDGEHGVRLLAAMREHVDVVLSDLQMPGPQGLDLVGRLRVQRPDLPIVFLSGFATAPHSLDQFATHGIELLGKPPDPEDLLRALQRAVDRSVRATGPSGVG